MARVTLVILMGLLSIVAATTTEKTDDMEGLESVSSSATDLKTAETLVVQNTQVQENYVGQYNTRTCSPLGTSVLNINQCCSVNAGPIDSTNIKKCCLAERSVCNEAPNSCCHWKQMACLESSPGSSILTCQRVEVQVKPEYNNNYGTNNYATSNYGTSNYGNNYGTNNYAANSYAANNYAANSYGTNTGYANNAGYSQVVGVVSPNYAGQSVVANGLNTVVGAGYGTNNYASNPVTAYAANSNYGQVDNGYNLGVNNLAVNNVGLNTVSTYANTPNNYGTNSGYGYAAAGKAAAGAAAAK